MNEVSLNVTTKRAAKRWSRLQTWERSSYARIVHNGHLRVEGLRPESWTSHSGDDRRSARCLSSSTDLG